MTGAAVVNDTFWIGLLWPNKVATPESEVLVAGTRGGAWPKTDVAAGVVVGTTGAAA